MIDELDEDRPSDVLDDTLIAMGHEDGDEDHGLEIVSTTTEEDLIVNLAASGDIDGLRVLLAALNAAGEVPDGHEAILEASRAGHTACVEVLLDAGVVVDAAVWPSFRGTFDHASIIRTIIEASVVFALENDHKSVLKILLRAGVALNTELARRRSSNEAAWTFVDLIRKLGSWDEYVRRHRVALLSLVEKMVGGALIPDDLQRAIADFVSPPGGN